MLRSEQLHVPSSVQVRCTQSTGDQLSSSGLFLNRAAVLRHIAASNPCFRVEEDLGFLEIQLEVEASRRAGDVMAGAGGRLTPAAR